MRRKLSRRKKMRRKLSRRWNFEELCLQLECRLCSLVITDQVTWTKWKLYSAKISPPCLTICCNSSQQKKEERSVEMQSHEAGLFRAAHAPLSSTTAGGGGRAGLCGSTMCACGQPTTRAATAPASERAARRYHSRNSRPPGARRGAAARQPHGSGRC